VTPEREAGSVTEDRPRVGISSCLLGQPVRFNGGHSRDRFLTQDLARYVEWVPVCPEVEIGLGAPREALRLTAAGRLVSRDGSGAPEQAGARDRARAWDQSGARDRVAARDHTDAVAALAGRRRGDLAGLSGYVFKSRSPSCGLFGVRVYAGEGGGEAPVRGDGRGAFAARVLASFPLLPAEEEGRLNDPLLRETFIEQVFARHRLAGLFGGRWRARDLIEFHARHKLQLMAHDPGRSRRAGCLVAAARGRPADSVAERYTALFAQAMAVRAGRGRHGNALQHGFGLVSSHLDHARRHDILDRIDAYRHGEVPLSVPVTLIRHHATGCGIGYLQAQTYLDPFPAGLGLRNHA
jgi:uncharacterized protein YbgA (DUF1722 family)/uncharacterized protein YbbK (DUF523 family)